MSAAAIAKAIEDDERRQAQESFRATGGSKRRPLKTFMTAAEKRDARELHAERLRAALDAVQEPEGFAAWLDALQLNLHLSAMNAALVALQTPGQVVASVAGWKKLGYRVKAGEHAVGKITAPGFWPLAYFTAAQAGAGELEGLETRQPPCGAGEGIRAALSAALAQAESSRERREALDAAAAQIRQQAPSWPLAEVAAAETAELPF